jgi:hypothetical protein
MHPSILLFLLFVPAAFAISHAKDAVANATSTFPPVVGRKCGVSVSDKALNAAEKHFASFKVARPQTLASSSKTAEQQNTNIDVYFHVVAKDKTKEGGYVP